MTVTYVKPFGKNGQHQQGVTLEVSKAGGVVLEHPFDSVSGAGHGRKHRAADPGALLLDMTADLAADGWTLQS